MSDLEKLLRWEAAGGTWRVLGRSAASAADVALCRCDGGEVVDRLITDDREALTYIADRETSETPPPELAD